MESYCLLIMVGCMVPTHLIPVRCCSGVDLGTVWLGRLKELA